ncbi:T9SS type A sorting domain-containing protein [Flavobacterium enshiense]|nr:T9SS type A sorting domain-containing protein [Flavobacterium enshiense]
MKTITFQQAPTKHHIRFIILLSTLLLSINGLGQNVYWALWDEWANNDWQKSERTINTYDGSNHLTHSIAYQWITPPGVWQNALQIDNAYNPDGTLQQSVAQGWDTGTNTWVNAFRSTYTYNAAKKVLTNTSYLWLGSWVNNTMLTNTYDGSGYLTQTLNQSWNFTGPWKNTSKTDFFNNPSGTVNYSVTQTWNPSNVWVNSKRNTYTYTGANKVLTDTQENWNGSAWVNEIKLINDYNGAGFVTIALWQNWNGTTWVDNRRSLYSYNGSNNVTQEVNQVWEAPNWLNVSRVTFGYTLGTEDFSLGKLLVLYPNPSADIITIKTNESLDNTNYCITDQTGRLMQTGQLNPDITNIDISQYSSGLYFFRIDKNYKSSIKILKQ